MYINKCTKCGVEFDTKNPKRVVCPDCLYPERGSSPFPSGAGHNEFSYKARFTGGASSPAPAGGGGYGDVQRGTARLGPAPAAGQRPGGYGGGGGYAGGRPPGGGGGYQNRGPGGAPGMGGGMGGPRPGGFGGGPPRQNFQGRGGRSVQRGPMKPRKLLVSKEQLIEIERLYKEALPLPNPDIHEQIAVKMELEPSKVFFGINLVRKKMKLSKLDYPKRKLAVSPDQMMAIEAVYEAFLPVPPIGVHKIIAKQLRIDEWRVHVAIGLIRKNRNMDRWNEDREDLPPKMKEDLERLKAAAMAAVQEAADAEKAEKVEKEKAKKAKASAVSEETAEFSESSTETNDATEAEAVDAAEAPAEKVKKPRAKKIVKEETAEAATAESSSDVVAEAVGE